MNRGETVVRRNAGKLVMVLYAGVVACGTPHPVPPSPPPPNPSGSAPKTAPRDSQSAPSPKDTSTLKDENGSYHYQSGPIAAR